MESNFIVGQLAWLFYDKKNRLFLVSILENTQDFLRVVDCGRGYVRKLLWQEYGAEWTIFKEKSDAEKHRSETRSKLYLGENKEQCP